MDQWSVGASLHTEGITEIHHYAGVRASGHMLHVSPFSLCSGLGDFMTLSLSLLVPVFVCLYGWVVDWLCVWLVGWLLVGLVRYKALRIYLSALYRARVGHRWPCPAFCVCLHAYTASALTHQVA